MKIIKRLLILMLMLLCIATGVGMWIIYGSKTTNPHNYKTIGEIPTPWGYERLMPNDGGYAEYLRSTPLKEKGSKIMLYTGGESRLQSLAYAVLDMPLLSNDEQCADVCMRLRAEYLYNTGKSGQIHFQFVARIDNQRVACDTVEKSYRG